MSAPTTRERQVLDLLATGRTAAGIGRRLGISERTVHKHLEHAYAKLGVHDRVLAVLRAAELGLLSRPLRLPAEGQHQHPQDQHRADHQQGVAEQLVEAEPGLLLSVGRGGGGRV